MSKVILNIFVAVSVFLAALAGQAAGATWYVDPNGSADFNTIQAAIDDPCTVDGDQIEVAPGTYYKDVNFIGKAVRLYSSGGPEVTIIDANGAYHAVQCVNGEDANTILEGFTITGGDANGPDPNDQRGGGMYNYNANPMVIDCTFSGNSADSRGGGMSNYGSSPTVTNCTFNNNSSSGYGGGMYNSSSSPTVTDCTFSGNSAALGGGMYIKYGSGATVTDCTFSGNSADEGGGMCNISSSNPTVTNCTFSYNTALFRGGGMYNYDSSPTVTNCTFSGNQAGDGGGIYHQGYGMVLTNCTFSGNEASSEGGGIYNDTNVVGETTVVTNCILWGNNPDQIYDFGNPISVSYSAIQGGWPASVGIIIGDPLFADVNSGDLRLLGCSPCVDAGNNAAVPSWVTTDLAGNSRFVDDVKVIDTGAGTAPIVDMGAYERQLNSLGRVHNIVQNTWYCRIQTAIDDANNGDKIEVLPGTYYEMFFFNGKAVHLYSSGGPEVTTIDGTGYLDAVVSQNGEDANTILEGFTITSGGQFPHYGMSCSGSSPTVTNCTFTNCNGGMSCGNASPTVTNCTFIGNSNDEEGGGGMYNYNSNPTVSNCTFTGNTSSGTYGGGGMFNKVNSNPTVTNCTFSGNQANDGGGMYNYDNSSPTVSNCTFTGNTSSGTYGGGGMLNAVSCNPTLTNCTFSGNSAEGIGGGGMYNYNSNPMVTNCILWSDTPDEIYDYDSTPIVTYSDVQGGYSGTGNINADPCFVDATNPDPNLWNLRLKPNSPCIDTADNSSIPADTADLDGDGNTVEPIPFDLDGEARIVDGDANGTFVVDMGAFEYRRPVHNITQDTTYINIQTAIDDANNGDEIEAIPGTYQEAINFKGKAITLRSTDPNDMSIVAATIIDTRSLSSSAVICVTGEDANTVLKGFTITGGSGSIGGSDIYGGGMYNLSSSPTVTKCIFSGCSAEEGGGMSNYYKSNPTVIKCTFRDNWAEDGAGMSNFCNSNPTVTNCAFIGNSAYFSGGGIWNFVDSYPMVTNCTFNGNSAYSGGGMYSLYNCVPTVTNCTFSGNSAANFGGGLCNLDCNLLVRNSIFWNNMPNQIYNGGTSASIVTYSAVQGGYSGTGNINADPCFVDATNPDPNLWNLRLKPDSPCIDAANNSVIPADITDLDNDGNTAEPIPYDFDGHPRFVDGDCNDTLIVDMGAFEFNYAYMGDFDYNCAVNFKDFSIFAMAWLTEPPDPMWNRFCDIGIPVDDYIDLYDLDVLVENWLADL